MFKSMAVIYLDEAQDWEENEEWKKMVLHITKSPIQKKKKTILNASYLMSLTKQREHLLGDIPYNHPERKVTYKK